VLVAAAVGLLGVSSGGLAAGALADPVPDSREVERGRQQVRDRAAEVGRLKARLAEADGKLEELSIRAEMAVEHYHGELVRLERARRDWEAAQRQVAEAERRLEAVRAEVAGVAAAAYRAESGPNPWVGVVAGRGGPQGAMDRAGLMEMMSRHRAGTIREFEAARQVAEVFRARATAALREQEEATARAEAAKRAAEEAVERQRASIARLDERKRHAERLLKAAEGRVRALEAKRRAAAASRPSQGRPPSLKGSSRGQVAARAALKWLGTPYSWGGGNASGPTYGIGRGARIKGFDCSGLALYAWAQAGVKLDHWTGTQWTSGPRIPLSKLRPGDLVFFARDVKNPRTIHHVGIYIGGGRMVEAPYTGATVRISSIWRRGLIGATRPAG